MTNSVDGKGLELSRVVVTLSANSDMATISTHLSQGVSTFCIRGDLHDANESRRLIELLRQTQTAMRLKAAAILQLDDTQLPPSKGDEPFPSYLHPSTLPQDIKQHILLAQCTNVEYVCLRSQADKDVVSTLRSCLAACACRAKILISLKASSGTERVVPHVGAVDLSAVDLSGVDGVFISAADCAAGDS